MAGIIGNMTAQKRARRDRKDILSNKCVYELQPFSSYGFHSDKHNKYIEARVRYRAKCKKKAEEEKVLYETQLENNSEVKNIISYERYCETILIYCRRRAKRILCHLPG